MNFNEYIKDKKVCFVGASPILLNKKMGDIIDSYDVVVRTNGSINLIEDKNFNIDYGKKIDVLYTNNQFYREMSPLKIDDYIAKGVKYLRMKTCHMKDHVFFNTKLNCRTIIETMNYVNKFNPSSTMGAYIFTDILKYNPKELYITGVDFFASKKKIFEHNNYREYYPGYLPDKIRLQGNVINKGKKEDGHNFKGNAGYIYHLWKNNENMVFPDYIENILVGIIEGRIEQND